MPKGYVVYPLIKQPRVNMIDEALIRGGIYLRPWISSEEDRMRIVNNREEETLMAKMQEEVETMSLHDVRTLLLSYRHIGRIENLYGFSNLTKLNLDNNHIQKIENIEHLISLQMLDLSYNEISCIEGLDSLVNLDTLSLYSNRITVVGGLDHLGKLTTLSLGKNNIDNLDTTVRYLHGCRNLKVLTLKHTPLVDFAHYRVKVLAYIRTLRFLDGTSVSNAEKAKAREEQRENLLPIDLEDEIQLAAEKAHQEEEKSRKEYILYNCPDETKLYDELMRLQPEGRNVAELLRSDAVVSFSKDILDRYQNEFNEKVKELADSMKAVRARRDVDDAAYKNAIRHHNDSTAAVLQTSMKQFTKMLKEANTGDAVFALRAELNRLKRHMLSKEAEQYDMFESFHNNTIAKWRNENADVILQSAFEGISKLESDFQIALRKMFDNMFLQRHKREKTDEIYPEGRLDDAFLALDNKEEYQKVIGEWFEIRRKRLEELEVFHLKAEENLLSSRTEAIMSLESNRHRNRICEISEFISQMSDQLSTLDSKW